MSFVFRLILRNLSDQEKSMRVKFSTLIISFFLALLVLPFKADAQSNTFVKNLSSNTNLPEGAINCLVQDNYGFIWIGTWKGLFRYDGYNAINFSTINQQFRALKIEVAMINGNDLWVGSYVTGLYKINLNTYETTHYHKLAKKENQISDNNIRSICATPDNTILIGTERGGLCIIDSTGIVSKIYTQESHPNILSSQQVSKTIYIKDHTVLLGNTNLVMLDLKTEKATTFNVPGLEYYISSIEKVNEDEFLVSSLNGLYLLKITNNNVEKTQLINHRIKAIIKKKDSTNSTFLIGSTNGILEYNAKSHSLRDLDISNAENATLQDINSIIYTKDNVLLIGCENGFFSYTQRKQHFNNYTARPENKIPDIISAIEKTDKNFFAGSWGKGLLKLNKQNNLLEGVRFNTDYGQSLNFIFSLKKASDNIWFSTKNNLGVFSFKEDQEPYKPTYYPTFYDQNNQPKRYTVTYIFERKNNSLLLATWEGVLFYYDKTKDAFFALKDKEGNLPSSRDLSIFSVIEDTNGNTWVALNGGGVIKMKIENNMIISQEIITEEEGLSSNFVTTLYQSRNNKIWVGTEAGLTIIDGKNFHSLFNKDITLDIQSITEDPIGFLWIGTQKGLIRMNSNNFDEPYKLFDVSDGLKNQSYYLNSIFRDKDYTLYFGGYKGIDFFTPYKIEYNLNKPTPQITNFNLSNEQSLSNGRDSKQLLKKNITGADELKLRYDQNTFSFEFSNLEYQLPEKCQFAYMLEGVDKDWNYRDANNRIAYYTKLAPGTYIFNVKSTNNDGVWCEKPKTITISINAPFWASTLSYIIYFIVAMVSIFFVMYLRIVKVQADHERKLKEIEYEKQKELDDMKSRFFTNISHEFRTPLTLILGPLSKILEEENDPIKEKHLMIFRNASRLLQLTNRIIDFRKSEKEQLKLNVDATPITNFINNIFLFFKYEAQIRNIKYEFSSSFNQSALIDHEFVESIIFNLLSNAFKYTPDNHRISVNIFNEGEWLKISFSDTGKGISTNDLKHIFNRFYSVNKQNSSGIGLSFSKRLVEIHKGDITVESEEGKGSTFTLILPLNDVYLPEEKKQAIELNKETIADWKKIDESLQQSVGDDLNQLKNQYEKDELIALVVDDNFEVRLFIKSLLENDFNVLEASNGKEALNLAFENIPDIIISDVMMPEMSGLELCQAIKTDERTDHIPIILTTVLSSQSDRIEGLSRGADSYIPKPIDPNHLLIRVNKLIEKRLKLKEKFSLSDYVTTPNEEIVETPEQEVHPMVKKAREIVLKNLDNSEYNIDDFCSDLGLSRMQLYRKFKAITGLSANSFIRKVRLHKAAEMLRSGQFTVKEVTYDVGFIDLKYFRKCFFDEFGVNPSEYAESEGKKG
jgi:signal transduction histidine kinase/ligand-binding sensor domain-containing protein/AraC-like DNA-binding protein